MDINDIYNNPLSFDEQIIAEKLGVPEYINPSKDINDINSKLKLALAQSELQKVKAENAKLLKESDVSKRETFVGNCGCGSEGFSVKYKNKKEGCQIHRHYNNDDSDDEYNLIEYFENLFKDRKVLLFMIFILLIFCVVQYLSYKSEMKEMMENVSIMMQHIKSMQTGIPVTQPIVTQPIVTQPIVTNAPITT